jgi:plasmid stabilization system protein ParE
VTRIVWTLQAIEDVEAIQSYIARDSPSYAALLAERIVESVERLKEFPLSGRVVPIVYRLTGERVDILTVVHAARLLPKILSEGTEPL